VLATYDRYPLVIIGEAFVVGSCEAMLYGPQILLDRDVSACNIRYPLVIIGEAFVVGSCKAILYGPQILLDRDVTPFNIAKNFFSIQNFRYSKWFLLNFQN
jgi:hypothetical protein